MNTSFEKRTKCSLCRSESIELVMELPATPLANEFVQKPGPQDLFPLDIVLCLACGHAQSSIIVDPKRLFGQYVYETSTSPVTVQHLRDQARTIDSILGLRRKEKCFVVEIGSNDGTLLNEFLSIGIPRENLLGVEPSETMARKSGLKFKTLMEFFSVDVAKQMAKLYVKPDVVVANNVFAHVPDVREMLEAVKILVGDTGILVMDVAHVAGVLATGWGSWDTIYHEHMSHHSLTALARALDEVGLPVFKAETMPEQNGRGSLRVWAGSPRARVSTVDEANQIRSIIFGERLMGTMNPAAWQNLKKNIVSLKEKMSVGLSMLKGKHVWGYGAPAKLTTFMYTMGMTRDDICEIADDSPWKQNLFTPGLNIPVVSTAELVAEDPDVVILFAWNFAQSMTAKLRGMGYQGRIVTPGELVFDGMMVPS